MSSFATKTDAMGLRFHISVPPELDTSIFVIICQYVHTLI